MNDFVNKWFQSQKPNLVARYDSNYIPPSYQHKKSMDRLKEIDRKLDLLPDYLAYRANIISEYNKYPGLQRTLEFLDFDTYIRFKDSVKKTWDMYHNNNNT